MEEKSQPIPRLTASEVSNLWTSYMSDSMAICVLKYFLANAQDEDVTPILKFALELSETHVEVIADIFTKEHQPVPQGFTVNDVDVGGSAVIF